jgi:hypothetical protein
MRNLPVSNVIIVISELRQRDIEGLAMLIPLAVASIDQFETPTLISFGAYSPIFTKT